MKFATLPIITLALTLGASAQTADQISCCKNYAAKGYTLEVMNYMCMLNEYSCAPYI
jgi:hypothetical protein|uniref:Extracellular membrane protein CFEM domain-containing protein n=1 Tax=Bionectria ochroleuca TaxID=29856 RepID=A0A8H7KAW7_BIOOC